MIAAHRQAMKRHPYTIIKTACWLLFCFYCSQSFSQTDPFQWTGESPDDLNWKTETENEYRQIMEEQDESRSRPVDLNASTADDLARIPYINAFQRKNLFDYLADYGEVFSIYELHAVPGFDSVLIRKITPFICFNPVSHSLPMSCKNLAKYGKHQVLLQAGTSFPRSAGYMVADEIKAKPGANYYPGSPYGMSFRYSYSFYDRLSIGISGDKDAGEQFFAGPQKYGMDTYSGYLSFTTRKIMKRLIIGNFRAGWGLGLTFNTGSSLGIYPGFNQEFSVGKGISPSQSLSESSVLRGIAVNIGYGRFTLSGICSYRNRDATVVEDLLNGITSFSAFVETGYHRTFSEISKRGKISEMIVGANLNFRSNFFSLGLTVYSVSLSAPYQPKILLYNLPAFTGKNNFVAGVDFNIFYRFVRLSGEVSRSENGSVAVIAGLNLNPDPRFSAVLLYRNYPPAYQNLYSNCFRQNTYAANERAWFMGFTASLPLHCSLSLYADFCTFPWAKYGVSKPSEGTGLGAMLTWQMNSKLNCIFRYTYSCAETDLIKADEVLHGTGNKNSFSYRLQLNWTVSAAVCLQSRVEVKQTRQSPEPETTGWLLFQDISIKPLKVPLKIILRYSVFDCPYYESRIWAYEPDVLYGYSLPSYYGKGVRACALVKYSIGKHFAFCLKAGLTRYNDKNVISSGLDQINANWKLDLNAQIQVRI
jgi:Helix-hairpin-helix motif